MASCVRKKAESKREGTPLPFRAEKKGEGQLGARLAIASRELTIAIASGAVQHIASAVLKAV